MQPAPWKTWTALGLVYVVWGSTYLAISYVVVGLPPLLTAAFRFAMASLLIGTYVLARRGRLPFTTVSLRQYLGAAGIGLLLLLGGNGGVTLAEQADLPSGLTALLIAGVPLFVVLLRLLVRDRPSARTLVGVGIGFVGLAVLLLPGARPTGVSVLAAATVVLSSVLWSVGSFVATRIPLPADPLVTTVAEMTGGALGLLVVGLGRGEQLHPGGVPASSLFAVAYLVIFGSVVAFTAYSWLLGTAPVSRVATYAYVNPVVAVVLGALIRGEQLTTFSVVGGAITVLAVAVVVSEQQRPVQVPVERQGLSRSART